MAKNIIFCADGTWNSPNHDDNNDNEPDFTNVYKLFLCLEGEYSSGSLRAAEEQEKVLSDGNKTLQVAKYIHGVGDSKNFLVRVTEGATGAGTLTRIVRGYTFISRYYEPGDNIFITGFSRGAYTARALADFIVVKGLLARSLTIDAETAYRRGAEAWHEYRKSACHDNDSILARLAEVLTDLPGFLCGDTLKDSDFVAVDRIAAVAVWDTVGALGIPVFLPDNQRYDAFRFTGTELSKKVEWGFHAVSLDEDRADFTPTLWGKRAQLKQMVFPGVHSDVGGGYPSENGESSLSDITLQWMLDELQHLGLVISEKVAFPFAPSAKGPAHIPWKNLKHVAYQRPCRGLQGHCSLSARAKGGDVYPDRRCGAEPYRPKNIPRSVCTDPSSNFCARCRMNPA